MSDVWTSAKEILENQMGQTTYNDLFLRSELLRQEGGVYIIGVPSHSIRERIEGRLSEVVDKALSGVAGKPVKVRYKVISESFSPVDGPPEELDESGEEAIDIEGAYLDKRNAIIQPDKIEQHTQYFRRKWRPLLGPLLSELIRELRQRCYYKGGRNSVQTTKKNLATALGVSRATIKRALAKKDGEFVNKHLDKFIKTMEVVKYRNEDGQLRNVGTRFVIFLDEPLIPKDEEKLTELPKGQNDPSVNVPKGHFDP